MSMYKMDEKTFETKAEQAGTLDSIADTIETFWKPLAAMGISGREDAEGAMDAPAASDAKALRMIAKRIREG